MRPTALTAPAIAAVPAPGTTTTRPVSLGPCLRARPVRAAACAAQAVVHPSATALVEDGGGQE